MAEHNSSSKQDPKYDPSKMHDEHRDEQSRSETDRKEKPTSREQAETDEIEDDRFQATDN